MMNGIRMYVNSTGNSISEKKNFQSQNKHFKGK